MKGVTVSAPTEMSQVFKHDFREFQGGYETAKKDALARHLHTVANAIARSATVEAYDGRWLVLQEWEEGSAPLSSRRGAWISDLYLTDLP